MLRTACIVVLLALTGSLAACTDDASSEEEPTAAPTQMPSLGACRLLTRGDVEQAGNTSPVVSCSQKHTAQTFAVGSFPAAVAAKGIRSSALGAYVFGKCKPAFRRFVGADDSLQELVRTMSQYHVKRVPVIDGHQLVGIVSEVDVASNAPQNLVVDLVKGVYTTS